jgi:phosphoribosylformylglycinamidine synthase
MLLAVPPENLERVIELFAQEDVEATCIGEFTGDGELRLLYDTQPVGRLSMEFLHGGLPQRRLKAIWKAPEHQEPNLAPPKNLTEDLKAILASPNVCSKEAVIRRYDHEVQGGTVLKPLVGATNDGPSDGAIIKPLFHSPRGAIITNGINPLYGAIDPYWMAASAIDEALRNLVALGGDVNQAAILDNFSWGNPDLPDRMAGLVRASKACYDMAVGYRVPFISGKDSLYNEYRDTRTGESISIPPTLLISALGIIPDVSQAVSMDLKAPGSAIYLVGMTQAELGGSHYYMLKGFTGRNAPEVDPIQGREIMLRLHQAIGQGLVAACHDLSEGGLGVAGAEMAFAGGLGMELELGRVPSREVERDDYLLFSESNTRFLVEVAQENRAAFEETLQGLPCASIGQVVVESRLRVLGREGQEVVSAGLAELKEAWQRTLGEDPHAGSHA